jgi:16S rRNA G966 N2-methylase RsmD
MEKLIKQLIEASYTDENLDFTKVQKIASYLNRKMLKEYIKALKRNEKKTTVFVDLPYDTQESEKKAIHTLFT